MEEKLPFSTKNSAVTFPQPILNAGFIMALILSGLCLLLAGWYMMSFEYATSYAVNKVVESTIAPAPAKASLPETDSFLQYQSRKEKYKYETLRLSFSIHMYISRILLLSCGVLVGLAFGFLGFGLFLVGVKGDVDADLEASDRYRLKLARLSPGLFVILCSTILIGVCATRSLPVDFSQKGENESGIRLQEPKLDGLDSGFNKLDTSIPH
jgi:hypothetical protein